MSGAVYPLQDNQARAVDPADSVWLSASAGTGKTQVLSARVLRLLLQPGVDAVADPLPDLHQGRRGRDGRRGSTRCWRSWVRLKPTRARPAT